jgi:hypothetical protein
MPFVIARLPESSNLPVADRIGDWYQGGPFCGAEFD